MNFGADNLDIRENHRSYPCAALSAFNPHSTHVCVSWLFACLAVCLPGCLLACLFDRARFRRSLHQLDRILFGSHRAARQSLVSFGFAHVLGGKPVSTPGSIPV
jgi:hypothetical protein